jgi:hypothetical protein
MSMPIFLVTMLALFQLASAIKPLSDWNGQGKYDAMEQGASHTFWHGIICQTDPKQKQFVF